MASNPPGRADAVQQHIAPYAGRTSLFLFAGISLILANLVLSQQGWGLVRAIFPSLPAEPASAQQTSILGIVGESALLGGLLIVSTVSDEGGTLALVFLAALWLVFIYNHRALFGVSASGSGNQSGNQSGGSKPSGPNAFLS